MLREAYEDHMDEPQVWLYRSRWWRSPRHFARHWLAAIIQAEGYWQAWSGNHMAWRWGGALYEAAWPRVHQRPSLDSRDRNAHVEAFAFRERLSPAERGDFRGWLVEMLGTPYDWLLLTARGLRTYNRLAALVAMAQVPVVNGCPDVFGAAAVLCYELVARGLRIVRRGSPDPATFGPGDLWRLAEPGGPLLYRGRVRFPQTAI